jgi:hypothetical protein
LVHIQDYFSFSNSKTENNIGQSDNNVELIYKRMEQRNLEYNTYWHYSIVRFWIEMIHKYADYSVPFEDVYNAKSTEWIKNPKLWNYYYSPDKLFSPYARDSWVQPDLRRI